MRIKALVLAAVIMATALAAPASGRRPRRAMLPYRFTDPGVHVGAPGFSGAGVYDRGGTYEFRLRDGETAVSVMVLDDTERPVSGLVAQWTTDYHAGNAAVGHAVTYEKFCGRTDAPVEVEPDVTVHVVLQKGACEDGTPSVPTTGDVVVDFHRG